MTTPFVNALKATIVSSSGYKQQENNSPQRLNENVIWTVCYYIASSMAEETTRGLARTLRDGGIPAVDTIQKCEEYLADIADGDDVESEEFGSFLEWAKEFWNN